MTAHEKVVLWALGQVGVDPKKVDLEKTTVDFDTSTYDYGGCDTCGYGGSDRIEIDVSVRYKNGTSGFASFSPYMDLTTMYEEISKVG